MSNKQGIQIGILLILVIVFFAIAMSAFLDSTAMPELITTSEESVGPSGLTQSDFKMMQEGPASPPGEKEVRLMMEGSASPPTEEEIELMSKAPPLE